MPGISGIIGLSAVTGMLMLYFIKLGKPGWLMWTNLVLTVYFSLVVCLLWRAFRLQLKENLYSYDTIFYFGFALFILSLAGTYVYITFHCFQNPQSFREAQTIFTLLHSAKNYMLLTAPFLLLFAASLFISNIMLIRHEGFRFVNVLGIILSFLLIAGQVLIDFLDYRAAVYGQQSLWENLLINLLAAFYLYFECMIIGSAVADVIAAKTEAEKDRDFLIILGCALKKDGTPTPLLRGRLDLALQFRNAQLEESSKEACFVVSGGQGADEVQSEAASMQAYLLEQGIPHGQILAENRSVNTLENMLFSKEIIDGVRKNGKVAFFTTNYHVFRAGLKAEQAGLDAVGMGAPTKWYFWPNAAVREYVGLLTEHRRKQAIILFTVAAIYTALTVLAYT